MTDLKKFISELDALASEAEAHAPEVAAFLRRQVKGDPVTDSLWLCQWASVQAGYPHGWRGHSLELQLGDCPCLRMSTTEFSSVALNHRNPENDAEMRESERARELGLDVIVEPRWSVPEHMKPCTKNEFEQFLKSVRLVRVDRTDERQEGVTSYGFALMDEEVAVVGSEFLFSRATPDGQWSFSARYSAHNGPAPPLEEIPDDAEWRIPRELVERVSAAAEEFEKLRRQERETEQRLKDEADRQRLAKKFGLI